MYNIMTYYNIIFDDIYYKIKYLLKINIYNFFI